jgi:subtilisin family serine protease
MSPYRRPDTPSRFVVTALAVFLLLILTASLATGAARPGQTTSAATNLYIIQLTDPPLAAYRGGIGRLAATSPAATGQPKLDAASPASLAYRAYLAQEQAGRVAALEQLIGRPLLITYHYDTAFNGLALPLTAEEAAVAAALPGVAAVYPDEERELLTDAGPGWIGAAGIWDGTTTGGLPGTKGEGIIVGIVDTGINTDHPAFADVGGDGYDHTNPFGSGNYVGWCNPGYAVQVTCNDKLIGAWSYSGSGNNPEDPAGHGSHVASTAAGNVFTATLANGATLAVGVLSGVAPHANIIAYDVCLASCPTTAMVAGIDQAVLDGVDVINLSISGGRLPYSDPV